MSSGCSQMHDLGKVRGTELIEAFGLSDICYILSLLRPNKVKVDDQNHHPQMHPSEGNSLGDQTTRVVGLVDSHRDVLAPSPELSDLIWLEQWPFYLLELSWGQWQGRTIFLLMYLLL